MFMFLVSVEIPDIIVIYGASLPEDNVDNVDVRDNFFDPGGIGLGVDPPRSSQLPELRLLDTRVAAL